MSAPLSSGSAMLERARAWLNQAQRVTVLTGAGISAESGVPTFRGAAGLWRQFRPEELATPRAFARDPQLVWAWYDWRRSLLAKVKPNAGHEALAKLERQAQHFTLITQNVDGLHQLAGSQSVLEIHGSIWRVRCTGCRNSWEDRRSPLHIPVQCSKCGAQARPDVVWFGESLPEGVWEQAEHATEICDVLLVIGTSAMVYPAAGLAPFAQSAGAKIIEVNIEPTALSGSVDCVLTGRAGDILPQLIG